jgi:hypothetical protein
MVVLPRPLAAAFLLLLTLGTGSCSLQSRVSLTPGGQARIQASLGLQPQARDAWKSLRDLDPTLPADPLAPSLWLKGLGEGAQATPTAGGLKASFTVADAHKLLPGLVVGEDQWDLTVDRATLRRLTALSAWADSPALDSLVPAPGTSVTEADYRDLLVYLLGPNLSEAAARAVIDASTVELTLEAPRPIVTAPGAARIAGNDATFRWPLVKVLALPAPLRIRITF